MFIRKNSKEYIVNESQLLRMLDLLNFFICAYISYYVSGNVFAGACFFMACFGIGGYLRLYGHKEYFEGHVVLFLLLTSAVILPVVGIIIALMESIAHVLLLAASAALFSLRSELTHSAILYHSEQRKQCLRNLAIAQLLPIFVLYILLGLYTDWAFSLNISMVSMVSPVAILVWFFESKGKRLVEKVNYAAAHIASYRLYSALLLCSNIALYLSIMTYTGMFLLMKAEGVLFLPAVLWFVLVLIVTVLVGRLINRNMLKNMEKTTLFILGATIWLLAHIQLNKSFTAFNISMAWMWSVLQTIGLAIMLLLATYMQEDMRLVLELTEDGDEASVKTNRTFTQQMAFIFSGVLICAELYFMNLVIRSNLFGLDIYVQRGKFMRLLNTLPLGFVLLAILFALFQPLSRDIVRKLKLYSSQKAARSVDPVFEFKLIRLLINRYRKRIGIRILALVLRPWYHHKVVGAEKVQLGNGPVIFVANHRHFYGPIVAYLYLPFLFRPWIEHRMLEREKIMNYIWKNTISKIKPKWLARVALRIAGPMLTWALNSVEPIPVYRDSIKDAIKTIKQSVSALQEKDNILIFPENPRKAKDGQYALSGIAPFFTGFVSVAKHYYHKTGNTVTFYPVYLNHDKRTITFGDGVAYDPLGKGEEDRVCGLLMDAMTKMAQI